MAHKHVRRNDVTRDHEELRTNLAAVQAHEHEPLIATGSTRSLTALRQHEPRVTGARLALHRDEALRLGVLRHDVRPRRVADGKAGIPPALCELCRRVKGTGRADARGVL